MFEWVLRLKDDIGNLLRYLIDAAMFKDRVGGLDDPELIDAAIDAASVVLVPTGASPLDLMRAWPTLQVTAHRPTAVLLTQVMLNSKLATEARAALEDEGVAVIATPILRREHVRQAFAATPRDLVGYNDVLGELLAAVAEEVPA
jgi:chromosome partitioning protein